jgi:hypothetical protein
VAKHDPAIRRCEATTPAQSALEAWRRVKNRSADEQVNPMMKFLKRGLRGARRDAVTFAGDVLGA